jgi:F-type H+-transporting ATPase subunit delta
MGSATSQALAGARAALAGLGGKDSLATGEQLFEAARVIGDSAQLRSALADSSADPEAKAVLVAKVFGSLGAPTKALLTSIAASRWSTHDDLLAGIEEIGIRAIATSAKAGLSIVDELMVFQAAVDSDAELELAVGSKLGSPDAKGALVRSLLSKKASAQTVAIVEQLVRQPRGRRIAALLSTAADIVADEAGLAVATVITAAPLTTAQLDRLRAGLAKSYGRDLKLNHVIDPAIIGGVRVQVGDDVIDGSVSTRLTDLRLQLAG